MYSGKLAKAIYIGYDSAQAEAYYVCRESMIKHGCDPAIIFPLVQRKLREDGIYWRPEDEAASTEFSLTRFLVPYLSGYTGRSLFCDSDFLWRCNPMDLFDIAIDEGFFNVHVVKHDLSPDRLSETKMNGKPQEWYPNKNWSSLMLFENKWCTRLTPEYVNNARTRVLHRFAWSDDWRIGELDPTYNTLVGYPGYDTTNPKAVHFTDGGPWLPGYENVPFAEEWRSVQRTTE